MKRDSDDIRRVQDAICRRVASGEALPSICRDETLPDVATVFEWLADGRRAAFRDRLRHAQAVRRDMLAEQILDIADGVAGGDDGTDPEKSSSLDRDQLQLAKLRIDARKRLMARTNCAETAPAEASPAGLWRELLTALDGRHRGLPAGGERDFPPAGPSLEEQLLDEQDTPFADEGDD